MIDYERYDHTYCRVAKESEEHTHRKRKFSSASYEKHLDDEQLSDPLHLTDKDCVSKREPVIIVRTKRPSKTLPSPTVSYTIKSNIPECSSDDLSDNFVPDTSVPKINSDKGKYVNSEHYGRNALKEAKASVKAKIKKRQPKKKKSSENLSDMTAVNITPVVTEVTRSGRVRKLTPKTIENYEQSLRTHQNKSKTAPKHATKTDTTPKDDPYPMHMEKCTSQLTDDSIADEFNSRERGNKKIRKINATSSAYSEELAESIPNQRLTKTPKRSIKNGKKKGTMDKLTDISQSNKGLSPIKVNRNVNGKSMKVNGKTANKIKQKLIVVTKPPPKRKSITSERQTTNIDSNVKPTGSGSRRPKK